MSEQIGPESPERDLNSIAVATTLGFGIAVSLAILIGGGVWLDTRFDSAPLWMLVGLVLGLVSAGYQLWELVLASRKDKPNGPLGRKISSRRETRRH